MSVTGNPETGGRPLSTADLAAAARRPDAVGDNEEPVLNKERPATASAAAASSDREETIQPQSAGGAEAQQRTTRRSVDQKVSAGNEARSAIREGEANGNGNDVRGQDRGGRGARPAEEADAQARGGRWFNEKDATSADTPQADAASSGDRSPADTAARSGEALEPLFTPDLAETYRLRWTSIQSGFVDDPRQAVRSGDELVAQIMTNLADTFAGERHRVEAQLDATGEGSTEELRVTLRRYRSFFERLLSL